MRWIKEHKLAAVVLAVVIIAVLISVLSFVNRGNDSTSKAADAPNSIISGISGVFSGGVDSIKESFRGIFKYKELEEELEALEKENAELAEQLAEAKLNREELEALEELSGVLNYEYTQKDFDLISADVISYDGSMWTNIFTINVGTSDDVQIGDTVINGLGLVGQVDEVGKHWAKVVSLTDGDSAVSFKLARDRKQLGIAKGSEDGKISGYMMDADSTVAEGDILITSGIGTFPKGLELGSVKSVIYNSNTLLKEVEVEPAVDFKMLDKVSVIR